MNSIERSLFINRIQVICAEMGAVLRSSAVSPNIKDRLDFSCALFDSEGLLCAQAAHIPVHLGSMAYAMGGIIPQLTWRPGDMVIVNDPYLGGTHLPDVTLIAPLFAENQLLGFAANRAHHADIGAKSPGSMPVSCTLEEEGIVIPPTKLIAEGRLAEEVFNGVKARLRAPEIGHADLLAQVSGNQRGERLVGELAATMGLEAFRRGLAEVHDYAHRLALGGLKTIPQGVYRFADVMDDDGQGNVNIPIKVALTVANEGAKVDFSGTAAQVGGNINCPKSVTAAAVYYCFHCLMPAETPPCAGSLRPIEIIAPAGSLLNAAYPAAVAAGNVETSMRIVDVVAGALAQALPDKIPAASQGSMNNIAFGGATGGRAWDYYETIGGGTGGNAAFPGLDAIHSHMTNTLNTPIEALEMNHPVRVTRYGVRRGSGGAGRRPGGNGIVREYLFKEDAQVTLLTERRRSAPWGLASGAAAAPGANRLNGRPIGAKVSLQAKPGDRLLVETPGGGGWGSPA